MFEPIKSSETVALNKVESFSINANMSINLKKNNNYLGGESGAQMRLADENQWEKF